MLRPRRPDERFEAQLGLIPAFGFRARAFDPAFAGMTHVGLVGQMQQFFRRYCERSEAMQGPQYAAP